MTIRPDHIPASFVSIPIKGTTDFEGNFQLLGLAAGAYNFSAETEAGEWALRPRVVEVTPGESRKMVLQMCAPLRVAGKVVDAVTGQPLAGAMVIAIEPRKYGESPRLGHYYTEAPGEFELYLPDGPVGLYFGSRPPGYSNPDPQIAEEFTLNGLTGPMEEFVLKLSPVQDK